MLIIDNAKGYATITGVRDPIKITDQSVRASGRAAKAAPESMLAGTLETALGLKRAAAVSDQITTRDSVWQRDSLAGAYKAISTSLLTGDLAKGVAGALQEARSLKPEVAFAKHRTSVPPLMAELHKRLLDSVSSHAASRVEPAKAHIARALMPEPATDPGQAATAAIRAMEVRNRLASMTPAARVKVVDTWGRTGDIASLAAARDDPFGLVVSAEVMAEAESKALTALGGQFLADDLADAVAEHEQLEALSLTIFRTALGELREAGVDESLLTPWRLQKAVVDAANDTKEP